MANNKPHIVRIIARLNVGGPAKHVVWLETGLKRHGFTSTLLVGRVGDDENDMSYFAKASGVEPVEVKGLSREISVSDLLVVWRVFLELLRLKPDVVHTHTAKAGAVGRLAAIIYRYATWKTLLGSPNACRIVHTYHGHVFHSYFSKPKTWLFLTIERILAWLTDRIVVISHRQLSEINGKYKIGCEAQFAVVPLGLDLTKFQETTTGPTIRQELECDAKTKLIGIIGRLVGVKNHRLFLDAVAYLRESERSKQRVQFAVIGDGPLREKLQLRATELGINESVHFLGNRDDIESMYQALDGLLLTSLNEGTPLSILESMASGTPVASTLVGGVADLLGPIRHNNQAVSVHERGIGVSAHKPEAVASAVTRLIDDDSVVTQMTNAARDYVYRHHDKSHLAADVAGLYCELL